MQFKGVARIFSEQELKAIGNLDKYLIAKRWAAKEALAKAIGTGIASIGFANITIDHTNSGRPYIKLNEHAKSIVDSVINHKNYILHLSISDEIDYAIATVILEGV